MSTDTLLLGDCLDLLPSLDEDSIDMVLTDLPYGTTRNPWDSLIDLDRLWPELLRVTKPKAAIVMTAQMPFTAALVMSRPDLMRHEWVWHKTTVTGHLNAKRAPMKSHESVLVFATGQPTYHPQKTTGHAFKSNGSAVTRKAADSSNYGPQIMTEYASTERYPRTVITFPTDKQKSKLHPTQKPVALFEYMIRTYSDEGATVLDVAGGSATTAVAAKNTGRRYIVMEKDVAYFDVATERLAA